ncbi:MAG TPA: AMP-binding protein [Solirubrobacteraceae bacterium]|jgi:O-succinylbenzoic acid--CoA ligase
MIIEAWLERAAASRGGACALQTAHGNLSYAQLLKRARAGAGALAREGVRRGDKVAIALPPGLGFAVALHACMLAGAIAVPIDVRLGEAERKILAAGAALVVEEPLADTQDAGVFASAAHHELSATAAIIHTSGTTSAPKPIELTYENFLWSALGSAVALGSTAEERWLCTLPLSHVGGLSILIRSAIYQSTAIVHERFETDRVLHALRSEGITQVSLVATTLSRLLDGGLARPAALRCALTGGGPVPDALIARAREAGVPVAPTYGLTEACSQVTTNGPPLFCTRLRTAEDGEILVAGPTVARGALAGDGWLHTGDEGHLDEHGQLHVTGRKADTIITGGENVAPTEVESVLEAHPAVLEAAVLGRSDEQWGEAVVAIVLVRDGHWDAHELRAHCAKHLAPYKVPKRVHFTSTPLPRTRSGKLLRKDLASYACDGENSRLA